MIYKEYVRILGDHTQISSFDINFSTPEFMYTYALKIKQVSDFFGSKF